MVQKGTEVDLAVLYVKGELSFRYKGLQGRLDLAHMAKKKIQLRNC